MMRGITVYCLLFSLQIPMFLLSTLLMDFDVIEKQTLRESLIILLGTALFVILQLCYHVRMEKLHQQLEQLKQHHQ